MAPRKKPTPKPMFDLRHDFVESLENVCQQAIMLLQVVDTLIQQVKMSDGVKQILIERRNAMRAALMNEIDLPEDK